MAIYRRKLTAVNSVLFYRKGYVVWAIIYRFVTMSINKLYYYRKHGLTIIDSVEEIIKYNIGLIKHAKTQKI